jgi:hypothetical protein
MSKYVFKPIPDVVRADWANNTNLDFPVTDEVLSTLTLIVEADSEEEAKSARMPVSNILAWDLVETDFETVAE